MSEDGWGNKWNEAGVSIFQQKCFITLRFSHADLDVAKSPVS